MFKIVCWTSTSDFGLLGLLLEKFLWLDQVDPPFLALLLLRRRSLTRSGWAEWKKAGKSNKKEIARFYSPPLSPSYLQGNF